MLRITLIPSIVGALLLVCTAPSLASDVIYDGTWLISEAELVTDDSVLVHYDNGHPLTTTFVAPVDSTATRARLYVRNEFGSDVPLNEDARFAISLTDADTGDALYSALVPHRSARIGYLREGGAVHETELQLPAMALSAGQRYGLTVEVARGDTFVSFAMISLPPQATTYDSINAEGKKGQLIFELMTDATATALRVMATGSSETRSEIGALGQLVQDAQAQETRCALEGRLIDGKPARACDLLNLDYVRDVVTDAIAALAAMGLDVGNADRLVERGDEALSFKNPKGAYSWYQLAYAEALRR